MRLIDADELINSILNYCDMYDLYLPKHFIGMIEDAQTIEPPKGEWERCQSATYRRCSVCKKAFLILDVGGRNFCPNCGADMRKKV